MESRDWYIFILMAIVPYAVVIMTALILRYDIKIVFTKRLKSEVVIDRSEDG